VGAAIVGICAGAALLVLARAGAPETLLERGAYLVNTVVGCDRCHTPRDSAHKPIADMELAGGFEFNDGVIGHIVGPNITPDRETGIGGWTEAQIITALRNGKRPDGTIIGPPMPIVFFRNLSDRDAAAIAAYLHSVSQSAKRFQGRNTRSRCRPTTARPSPT
jgi:mono/diheme cytochrome c family protein